MDDLPGPSDGALEVAVDSAWSAVVFPGSSLIQDASLDLVVGKPSSGKGDGVGKVGCGLIGTLEVIPGKSIWTTHSAPSGGMGNPGRFKGLISKGWDMDLGCPVDPDEL